MLDSTLQHLTTYSALAKLAANAGETLVVMVKTFLTLILVYMTIVTMTCITPDDVLLRMAWQVRPKHHVYHHLGLDMCTQLYSCRFYHCFRDEASMKYGKRC